METPKIQWTCPFYENCENLSREIYFLNVAHFPRASARLENGTAKRAQRAEEWRRCNLRLYRICGNPAVDGKFQPAKAGEFSSGAFQPFAQNANGDRRAKKYFLNVAETTYFL
jgi:hypothetical protein